ncbi:uncharacterized protein Dwil_GK20346 [Drosophila willistoni]|uniref:GK20346 n=1 Tax=Drosophila willistoni TaxID=7260 RepID=B4N5C4_DROWI|nr:transmembrane protein 209 isoform X2 [Drosophila willistoni]EDW79563.1 uncharacterized protein Dwil_GK20346 [Drosophila willistoni]
MHYSRNNCSPLSRNPVVEHSLNLRLRNSQSRTYLKWFALNILILSVLIVDLRGTCQLQRYSYYYLTKYLIAILSGTSAVACIGKYLWIWFASGQMLGTEEQKSLLDDINDNSFKTIRSARPTRKPLCYDAGLDINDDTPIINWHSSFEDSCWGSQSMRRSPSPMRTPQQGNSSSMIQNNSLNASQISDESAYMSPYAEVRGEDFLTDPRQLPALMKKAERERSHAEEADALDMLSNTGSAISFWNYCNNAAYMLKTTIYQLAPAPVSSTENAQKSIEEFGSFQFKDSNSEVIKRISTDKLSQYVANLRYWISTTILQRLVSEINYLDDLFWQRGISDLKIGSVGLERLRKTAENLQFVQTCAPMLPMLLPFLDTFNNQEYLVQRIKELSQGSCIADYRWNSGNSHNGKAWGEHLPTDSAILFHIFCVYLDGQLMPLPQGGGRPFYSRYVLKCDEKRSTKEIVAAVHNRAHCAILSTSNHLNPKFNFISDKELHNCVYDRNNLFYVIIQFLIYMRQHQESALEGVNLGKTGINIMCVIED